MAFLVLAIAKPVQANRVDDLAGKHLKRNNAPGFSLAVFRDGKVIKAEGYGLANLEWNVPATAETVYQLASVTKQFTATAVMLLVEEGKVRLSDRISEHVKGLPSAWSNITVRHLLNMTSGIKDYLQVVPSGRSRQDFTYEQLVEVVADEPLDFAAGDRYRAEKKDSPLITEEFRKSFANSRRRFAALQEDTREMKSFAFVTSEEPAAPRRLGVAMARVCYYKMETTDGPHFYAIELTGDNRVGWVDFAD